MKQTVVCIHPEKMNLLHLILTVKKKALLLAIVGCLSYTHLSARSFQENDSLQTDTVSVLSLSESQRLQKPDSTGMAIDSLSRARALDRAQKDSLRAEQRRKFHYVDTTPFKDSLKIYYWRISENLGEFREAHPDTTLSGFPSRRYVDGMGVSMAYLGNLGTPAISRIFSEVGSKSLYMFADAYSIYNREPDKFNFINTRTPYSKLEYETEGGGETKNERLTGGISVNLNKALNFGVDIDYLYARGHYQSQGAKHIDFVLYSSYFSDRYRYHFFYNNRHYINSENGGITDDRYITSIDAIGETQNMASTDIPTRTTETWNRVKGSRFFYTHRYNLGFEKETGRVDEEGEDVTQFVTVASIIHTADLSVQSRKFISNNHSIDTLYANRFLDMEGVRDTTKTFRLKNTLGLSLREGFSNWAKFDLTAYASFDYRQYSLMESFRNYNIISQNSTYVGGEIAKTSGKILRYQGKAELGLLGDNLGDVDITGTIETRIPVLKDTASLKLYGYMRNQTPSFYEQRYHSKYFWWDNDFNQVQRVYLSGELKIPHTKSILSAGVENLSNYVYFNENALPEQHGGSVQVINLRWDQKIKLGVLHWDNQVVYQKSTDNNIIPVPDLSVFSNLYLNLNPLPVLNLQLGTYVHYFSKYYSPTYEMATQQFHLQKEVKVGNYPLASAYVNCRLHQVRFFINFYNLSSNLIDGGAYFSLPHYPVKPMVMKIGLSIDLNN